MKNASLILNVFLTIAVIVLYVLHFNTGTGPEPEGQTNSVSVETTPEKLASDVKVTKVQGEAVIVYVNIDTLLEKYQYYQDVSDEIERNLQNMENSFKARVMRYQTDMQDYISKAEKGLVPKETAIGIEEKLMKEKTSIENEERNIGLKQEKEARKLEPVQKKLYDFFKEFVAKNNYSCVLTYTSKGEGALGIRDELDVTRQVLEILNEDYTKNKKQPTLPK
ncbi:MAG: OmpH family outer membrane protein [Bacteroidia bacterium]|nr:OmpH family outer membrane protein [Bacteroidia bacterium]